MSGPDGPLIGAREGRGIPTSAYSRMRLRRQHAVSIVPSAPSNVWATSDLRGKRLPRHRTMILASRAGHGSRSMRLPGNSAATRGEGAARPPRLDMRLNRALRAGFNRWSRDPRVYPARSVRCAGAGLDSYSRKRKAPASKKAAKAQTRPPPLPSKSSVSRCQLAQKPHPPWPR
jgi:hypothetical protein